MLPPPPRPGENNSKSTETTSCWPKKGVVTVHSKETQASKQCIFEAQKAMSMEVHQSPTLKGRGKRWQGSRQHS